MKNITRILIETTIRKVLKDMRDSPARSARNLVDLGLEFAQGRFQKHFLKVTSQMLQNSKSRYYDLMQDAVSNIDTEKLVTLGMNIGYNSCTVGAKTIREIEEKEGFNIPWSMHIEINENKYINSPEKYHSIIKQGQELGIYTWFMYLSGNPENICEMFNQFPDCAFILFCSPTNVTKTFIDKVSKYDNVLITVKYGSGTEKACMSLRERKLPYSIYVSYSHSDAEYITSGDLVKSIQALHPLFTVMKSDFDCSEDVRNSVYNYVIEEREKQEHSTILWEWIYDHKYIDSVISEDDCFTMFNSEGHLVNVSDGTINDEFNIFEKELKEILCVNFPKNNQVKIKSEQVR